MKIKDEGFFKAIRDFLTIYLPRQKCYSDNTVTSYKTALNLFVDFLTLVKRIPIFQITFSELNRSNVSAFLDWLQETRNSSSSTRNQRLMALRAFARYAGLNDVALFAAHIELSSIPVQRAKPRIVDFLSENALKALLCQPDIRKPTELRNQFLMILMYDTAARCQEILDLKISDFVINPKAPFVYLTGKGRKTRTVPLMPKTVEHLKVYLGKFHPEDLRRNDDLLFFTKIHGKKSCMSPDTAAYFMDKYGKSARMNCPEVPDRVHPHQLRHTRAIHLYRGGMPLALLSEFLGHADISTTQIYAYADTEMKRNAIQKACPESMAETQVWDDNDETTIRKLYGLA